MALARPPAKENTQCKKDGSDYQSSEKQHSRAALIAAELSEGRVRRLSFNFVRVLWSI